jgi:poly(A) polymerase Pap1
VNFLDSNLLILVISILAVGLIAIVSPMVVSFLKAKQVPTEDILNNIDELASIVKNINNSMNKDAQSKKVLDLIISSAEQAVKYSEQIYIAGQISEGERKEKAVQFVRTVLFDANIDITPERENLINSAIEAAVFLLPKTTKH